MAQERRRGAVDRINSAVDTARKVRTAYKLTRTATTVVSTSEIWIPVVIVAVVILILVFIILLSGSGMGIGLGKEESAPDGGSPGSGNISTCTFYRGGDATEGLTFGNPQMATMVSDISEQVGVPSAIVAGIMRVESGGALGGTDASYLSNDYDGHCSTDDNGNVVACGVMQFTPGTFITTFNDNSAEMAALFGKIQVRAEIDPRANAYPNDYLRIYSIRDSIIATAFKIKNDKQRANGNGPWDRAAIDYIINAYYGCLRYGPGGCASGPYNYGDDVWKSYTNCAALPIADASSCPIPNGVVNCGSRNRPINGPLGLCGHCGVGYGAEATAANCGFPGTQYAMDIGGADFSPVYLPKIGGNMIRWTFVGEGQGSQAIQRYTGVDDLTHEQYFISFHHTQSGSGNPGTHLSGVRGANICGGGCNMGHVHVEFGTGSQGNYRDAPDYFCGG